MSVKRNQILRIFYLVFLSMLILVACRNNMESCVTLGGVPDPPEGSIELHGADAERSLVVLETSFLQSTGASVVDAKGYTVSASFAEIQDHYQAFLDPGWQIYEDLNDIGDASAQVSGWTSCQDELLVLMYYPQAQVDGNGLIVLYARQ